MADENKNYNLNPFPTSPKPVFIRFGLLLVGIVCLWLFFHYLDKRESVNEEASSATKIETKSKFKAPQGPTE